MSINGKHSEPTKMTEKKFFSAGFMFILGGFFSVHANAMELDWGGQFQSEFNLIRNYSLDETESGATVDQNRLNKDGYYISGGGSNNASFQNLFLRLRPRLIVNDNFYVKSEWWVGDPIYGLFGSAAPYPRDQHLFNSTFSRGSSISAQRFWGEFLTDFGTLQVGRAPLNYGLGVVWSGGDSLWDHYQSTGDLVRLISKLGSFTFAPAFISYSTGNNVSGSCNVAPGGVCNPQFGNSGVTDYSIVFKYENADEDFEAGVNFIKRLGGASQDLNSGYIGFQNVPVGMNFNTWDFYGRKRMGRLTVAGEVPLTSGIVGGVDYPTFGVAGEAAWKVSDNWDLSLKAGHAPGQDNSATQVPKQYRAFYFHPNYHVAMIMFNYQLANLSGPQTLNNSGLGATSLRSPYDNPITNATYASVSGSYTLEKWRFDGVVAYATAAKTASTGNFFLNSWTRKMSASPAVSDQGGSIGLETDLSTTFRWDEFIHFKLDMGFFFPGDYFKFSNAGTENRTDMVFATAAKVGVAF